MIINFEEMVFLKITDEHLLANSSASFMVCSAV
jgi:hypothetical protein